MKSPFYVMSCTIYIFFFISVEWTILEEQIKWTLNCIIYIYIYIYICVCVYACCIPWPVDVTKLFPQFCCWTLIRLSRHWAWLHRGYWRYRSLVDWLIDKSLKPCACKLLATLGILILSMLWYQCWKVWYADTFAMENMLLICHVMCIFRRFSMLLLYWTVCKYAPFGQNIFNLPNFLFVFNCKN